ncbi:helix-turn-helix domain-containing protein [Rothia nasimurium]|uniref:helix-turn-helix domain-containing protein n=1 Tax=Rothia nasimurium TaxID=85336 RepID=UPI001F2B06FD|nr:helix-turn-helix domain-containing protein [Rothia nasimurium]
MPVQRLPETRPRLGIYGHGKQHKADAVETADIRLYTPKEVQDLTGVPVSTLANWRNLQKGIPYVKVGSSVRYEHSAIAAYIAGHRITPEETAVYAGRNYGGLRLAS